VLFVSHNNPSTGKKKVLKVVCHEEKEKEKEEKGGRNEEMK